MKIMNTMNKERKFDVKFFQESFAKKELVRVHAEIDIMRNSERKLKKSILFSISPLLSFSADYAEKANVQEKTIAILRISP